MDKVIDRFSLILGHSQLFSTHAPLVLTRVAIRSTMSQTRKGRFDILTILVKMSTESTPYSQIASYSVFRELHY